MQRLATKFLNGIQYMVDFQPYEQLACRRKGQSLFLLHSRFQNKQSITTCLGKLWSMGVFKDFYQEFEENLGIEEVRI